MNRVSVSKWFLGIHERVSIFKVTQLRVRWLPTIWAIVFSSPILAAGELHPWEYTPKYQLKQVDQVSLPTQRDLVPKQAKSLKEYSRMLAMDATIYGLPSVLQYRKMYEQAIDKSNLRYIGFNKFAHDRNLADPNYKAFQAPNVDTLYSNAWLDLRHGPVLIKVPESVLQYFTLQFIDMYGNSSNIGTRTYGNKGGSYLITYAGWDKPITSDATVFRVATPQAWVLMRVFAKEESEIASARKFQDSVTIAAHRPDPNASFPSEGADDGLDFFRILDYLLRTNGHPGEEEALVYRFNAIGIGGQYPFSSESLNPAIIDGMKTGYKDALKIIAASSSQLGTATGTGWNRNQKGQYGFNYLNRAVINYVGLGANVVEENYSFSTFTDNNDAKLDGTNGKYVLTMNPPPVDAFWSLTLYEGKTFQLYQNSLQRYSISERTDNLKVNPDGSITIRIQHEPPAESENWLPAPNGTFFLALRTYLPKPELLTGKWLPPGVFNANEKNDNTKN